MTAQGEVPRPLANGHPVRGTDPVSSWLKYLGGEPRTSSGARGQRPLPGTKGV